MPYHTGEDDSNLSTDNALRGTTYRVYRYILKKGRPVGISEVQKGLGLSSPSVSSYHIRKLVRLGLIKEVQEGYIVDKIMLENIIRIGRVAVPIQTGYLSFFSATLIIMLTFFRPGPITSLYLFAVAVNAIGVVIFAWETRKSLRRL
jgi:predicted DNA-binding transcriptional regulator